MSEGGMRAAVPMIRAIRPSEAKLPPTTPMASAHASFARNIVLARRTVSSADVIGTRSRSSARLRATCAGSDAPRASRAARLVSIRRLSS